MKRFWLSALLFLTPLSAAAQGTEPLFHWGDLGYAAVLAGGSLALSQRDGAIHDWIRAHRQDGAASALKQFGGPTLSLALPGATWLVTRTRNRKVANGAAQVLESTVTAGVLVTGMKMLAGRERPYQTSSPDQFHGPTLHDASFPSGHTTMAFALARSLDKVTTARWVPFVVYPLAAGTAWSRMNDNDHWASDVWAGAVVGIFSADKINLYKQDHVTWLSARIPVR